MKTTFLTLLVISFYACSANKAVNVKNIEKDSLSDVIETKQDSLLLTAPACVRALVKKFQAEEKQNPPRSVYRYTYQAKTVYYVPAQCCDFESDLYDEQCNLIAHPDGGFTGRGDGRAQDFKDTKSDGLLIWKDTRK